MSGNVVPFVPRHVRASAGSAGCDAASASKVMCERPFSLASRTMSDHRRGGIPRVRQVLTVDSGKPNSADTDPVPPSSLMVDSGVSIEPSIVRTVRTCQEFASRETTFPPAYVPIGGMSDHLIDPPEVIGPRLRRLRIALKVKTQFGFAQAIGVEKNTYNPWEKGTRPLTFEGALLIRKRYRIPLEYLFFGEFLEELPHRVKQALDEAA